MNTIPTTFNGNLPSYTAVGGSERKASTGLSAVVLNRGGRYSRYSFFEELEKAGFDYIISMEGSCSRYDLENLSSEFPFVRFILLKEPVSCGENINIAAAELSSPLFFVLWNDVRLLRGGGAGRMAERLLHSGGAQAQSAGDDSQYKRLCTVPMLQDCRSESIPTLITPALSSPKKSVASIKTVPFFPVEEGLPSLYPFDGIGIYDRNRFIRLGGFDPSIQSFHWQLMDFGFRSRLWGEEIASTQLIKLSYEGAIPHEDGTAESGYKRFILKNLVPVFRTDYAHIPLRRFPWYYRNMGSDFFAAWDEFSAARQWVKTNRYRFTSAARTIVERWESLDVLSGSQKERQ
ncbi:MAG: hypothetical protein FWC64_10340 [Treponema sp.]|nr:hypothetical protein [Treponema sp.]